MKKLFFTLSLMILLASSASAQITEMKLTGCYSETRDNLINRVSDKGNTFIANKNYNSIVEILPQGNSSNNYKLINFNTEYAEGKTFESDGEFKDSNGRILADKWAIIKMFYSKKFVEIRYYNSPRYKDGKLLREDQREISEGGIYTYTCKSGSITK
jgi:hypothetical protein